MITYVNTVLVGNLGSSELWTPSNGHLEPETTDAGKFVIMTMDKDGGVEVSDTKTQYVDAETASKVSTIRVGYITNKTNVMHKADGMTATMPVIKWSAVIKNDAIKSYTSADYAADTEDATYINFGNISDSVLSEFAKGGKRIIVRLTFKDLPTRFRKWTESYEYVTEEMSVSDSTAKNAAKAKIASDIAKMINKEYKRARVIASVGTVNSTPTSADATLDTNVYYHADSNWGVTTTSGQAIKIVAMPYDDDNVVDSLSWYEKCRFNANVYWTNPAAEGWESLNKNFPKGAVIYKIPGKTYQGSAKLVRDREAQGMGYQGILNRGDGTWPVVKPDMQTVLTNQYKTITLEFENMYRAADDIFRKTKQSLEIYAVANSNLKAVLDAFVAGEVKTALAGKLDTPAASSITDGHLAVWDKTEAGVVTLEDGGANG